MSALDVARDEQELYNELIRDRISVHIEQLTSEQLMAVYKMTSALYSDFP
jgi:hypothetical protein